MMTKTTHILTCSNGDGAPETIAQVTDFSPQSLLDITNACVTTLSVAGFRGVVTFQAKRDGNLAWTSIVTFTDDIPKGTWLNTFN